MVKQEKKNKRKRPTKQGRDNQPSKPNKIKASTPYDFKGKNLTPFGGLLPVATMLEKLGFAELVQEMITSSRETRVMSLYQFVLGIVLGLYIGFPRLNHLRFIAEDPIVTGIVKVKRLPPQSTLWRFMAALHLNVEKQILSIQKTLRERAWQAANVQLNGVTLDTDTTVHTVYGQQMGARKGYNPKNKGKKSYQPMLTFIAETREYLWGGLHNGDRPSGQEIGDHIRQAVAALPSIVQKIFARADAGFYCAEAAEAYEEAQCQFVITAQKTKRLVSQLNEADWKPSPKTDADDQSEFFYQPEGWSKGYRFVALRYNIDELAETEPKEQYQLFDAQPYRYRVFVTNMKDPIAYVVWFYNQRGGAENLIKEANNDAGLAAYPSGRYDMNRNHFQLVMLAYNLNCWLMLFSRPPKVDSLTLKHTTLQTARLRFLFIAAKIWSHAGRTRIHYSDHYEEKGVFQELMDRLRGIVRSERGFEPVITTAFT